MKKVTDEHYINYELEHIELFKKKADKDLIDSFNSQVRNPTWCHAKMIYLKTLQEELKKRYDTSSIMDNGNWSYAQNIFLKNKKIYTCD